MNSNCPICKSGVMEYLGTISLKNNEPLTFHMEDFLNPKNKGIQIYVCSLDECGHTEFRAAPGTLSMAKREIRKRFYQENLPNAN